MSEYFDTFNKNINRVKGICNLYTYLMNEKQGNTKEFQLTDILRSAVVFLHSSFEEYYRNTITYWFRSRASNDALKDINLPKDAAKNVSKYTLSDLLPYADKTIDELFMESIREYMSRKSFNSYSEICVWASKFRISLNGYALNTEIDKAVHRRHKIVHEADMNRSNEKERLNSIKPSDVMSWIDAYSELVQIIETQVKEWDTDINATV